MASPVSVPDEQRLFEDLMMGYEKSVRPVINANTILKVTFSLKLNQIIDLVSCISQTSLVKEISNLNICIRQYEIWYDRMNDNVF